VFYVADPDGNTRQRVEISGFRPRDLEDLARGGCDAGSCLYFADIGDNARRRDSVQIALIAESEIFPGEVPGLRVITASYPDGPHDAEAIAIHPSGDLWLATKSQLGRPATAAIFRLTAAQLTADEVQTFEHVGDIALASLGSGGSLRRMATSMDIAPDGDRFALLTYDLAIEFAIDLGTASPNFEELSENQTYRSKALAPLIQAESIVYAEDGRSLIYTTESIRGSASPLVHQVCRQSEDI